MLEQNRIDLEEWAGAVYQGIDYSWRFEVSTLGRLRNAKTKRIYSFGYGTNNYLQACVSVKGKRLNVRVHRCVAETFLDNPQHYRRLTLKQTIDTENVLLEQGKVIDFPLKPSDLSRYDEVLYD